MTRLVLVAAAAATTTTSICHNQCKGKWRLLLRNTKMSPEEGEVAKVLIGGIPMEFPLEAIICHTGWSSTRPQFAQKKEVYYLVLISFLPRTWPPGTLQTLNASCLL